MNPALWLLLMRGAAAASVVKPTVQGRVKLSYVVTATAKVDGHEAMIVDQGQLATFEGEFRQGVTRALFDPTTVKVSVKRPGGKVVTYVYGTDAALVKDSTGLYHLDQDCNLAGLWYFRWFSDTAAHKCADEQQLVVTPAQAVVSP
jgi:hypothetical protein